MSSYPTPHVDVNAEGWGPTALPEKYVNVPYAPFNKSDKLGKSSDFVSNFAPRGGRYQRDPSGVNTEFQYKHDVEEDASFQLVDTTKASRPRGNDRLRMSWNQHRFSSGRATANNDANSAATSSSQLRAKGQQKQNKRWDRLSNARRQFTSNRRKDDQKLDRQPTVTVHADWKVVAQFELAQLSKLQANIPKVHDLRWCGELLEYDYTFDRTTSRSNTRVHRYSDRDFYYVTTTDDPVIEELATNEKANIFATDSILSHLMASGRSVLPWDIVVQRVNNMVFLDKREQSNFDLVSVNENATDAPRADDPDSINHPDRLSLEATMINQNVSQQVVSKNNGGRKKTLEHPNPFVTDEDNDSKPASYAYRYRKFDLGENFQLISRCELHGISRKQGSEKYISSFALNEYDPKLTGGIEWRKKIDSQRGAILANELKNNACKLAKWTAQALISGSDEMKIAFVSRVNTKDPYSHVILGMQSYTPNTFATQIALNQNNMWGVVKMIAELMMEQPEGKYVIMKDPNKPVVRVYSVPQDSFEDEDEDGDDENNNDED